MRGDAEHRTGVYTPVHEDSSTASTKQFTSSVEFGKRSIECIAHVHGAEATGFLNLFVNTVFISTVKKI
ncbi:TPA: hypothetical protein ACP9FK_000851 [Legionella anisa]|uniref:hypothetical protein n=1 Tax=Legionella anisa TaxID=28082 RepID=UPI00034DC3B8|nr:hypothetical protein [Legionella anisa]